MTLRVAQSYCRICCAHCGMVVTIDDEQNKIVRIRGDKQNPMSRGYVCFKGLQAEEAHHGPSRLLRPLKRQADGSQGEIRSLYPRRSATAPDCIAERAVRSPDPGLRTGILPSNGAD